MVSGEPYVGIKEVVTVITATGEAVGDGGDIGCERFVSAQVRLSPGRKSEIIHTRWEVAAVARGSAGVVEAEDILVPSRKASICPRPTIHGSQSTDRYGLIRKCEQC